MFQRKQKMQAEIEVKLGDYHDRFVAKADRAPNHDEERFRALVKQANELHLEMADYFDFVSNID